MWTIENVPVAQLLLDLDNPRLEESAESQPDAYHALAEQQGRKLVQLARSIVDRGLDPLNPLAVVATNSRRRRYTVLEGNRRTLALKALESPSIVTSVLSAGDAKTLVSLSLKYHEDPIEEVQCILFDSEDEAREWILLRHTGLNEGAGLFEWSSPERDRFLTRHGDQKHLAPAGQVIEFLKEVDGAEMGKGRPKVKVTTLNRVINNPEVRRRLGLEKVDGQLLSYYPKDQLARVLRRIVEDCRTMSVDKVYTAEKQIDYLDKIDSDELPDEATKLSDPLPLDQLPASSRKGRAPKKKPAPKKKQPPKQRLTIVPATCPINPSPPRINGVYIELCGLDVTSYPNSGSVLLRVFLELSVDHYLDQHNVMTESVRRNTVLAKRLKAVADHLAGGGKIPDALKKAIHKVADSQHTIAAAVTTFHGYVHNPYVFPKPSELQTAWDELQPFLEQVWP